jgi:hypothetical protein
MLFNADGEPFIMLTDIYEWRKFSNILLNDERKLSHLSDCWIK